MDVLERLARVTLGLIDGPVCEWAPPLRIGLATNLGQDTLVSSYGGGEQHDDGFIKPWRSVVSQFDTQRGELARFPAQGAN